jgi:hypothetical protein
MPDAFEQELLTDISEAEAFGEIALAAEWRLELNTYRAAKQQAVADDTAWYGSSAAGSAAAGRREVLEKRQSQGPS